MIVADGKLVQCDHEGCEATRKNHHWGAIKAQGEGWFSQKDGTTFCPDHLPDWVPAWREKRNAVHSHRGDK